MRGRGSDVDELWAAVAEPTRRRLLDALLARGEATASTLATELPITRQAVAKHLAVLDRAGLVQGRRDGREVRYSVRPERLEEATRSMARVAAGWEERLASIKALAEARAPRATEPVKNRQPVTTKEDHAVRTHKTGTPAEHLAARLELLEAEKELTRRSDELARRRRALPWVPVEREYLFNTDAGEQTLRELFDGRSQLLIYHFMFALEFRVGVLAGKRIQLRLRGFVPKGPSRPGSDAQLHAAAPRRVSTTTRSARRAGDDRAVSQPVGVDRGWPAAAGC